MHQKSIETLRKYIYRYPKYIKQLQEKMPVIALILPDNLDSWKVSVIWLLMTRYEEEHLSQLVCKSVFNYFLQLEGGYQLLEGVNLTRIYPDCGKDM